MRVDTGKSDEVEALKWALEEANCTIAQLKEQLASKEHQLQRERVAREHAESAAEQAASAAEVAARAAVEAAHQASSVRTETMKSIAQRDQERISMEIMIQQEQAARKEAELAAEQAAQAAEVAAQAAIEASRHQPAVKVAARTASEDFDMEDVSDSSSKQAATAAIPPPLAAKKTRDGSKTQRMPAPTPEKPQNFNKAHKDVKRKMSLAEARKAAQDDMEKRIRERASMLSSKK